MFKPSRKIYSIIKLNLDTSKKTSLEFKQLANPCLINEILVKKDTQSNVTYYKDIRGEIFFLKTGNVQSNGFLIELAIRELLNTLLDNSTNLISSLFHQLPPLKKTLFPSIEGVILIDETGKKILSQKTSAVQGITLKKFLYGINILEEIFKETSFKEISYGDINSITRYCFTYINYKFEKKSSGSPDSPNCKEFIQFLSQFSKKELESIFLCKKTLYDFFNLENYTLHLIISLLTDPFDGHDDNFILELKQENDGTNIFIVNIDGDDIFNKRPYITYSPFTKDKIFLNVKTAIFALHPLLRKPINEKIKTHLINQLNKTSAAQIISAWIEKLNVYTTSFEKRISELNIHDPYQSLQLSESQQNNLVQTIENLKYYLPTVKTNNELFEKINPAVHHIYNELMNSGRNTQATLETLWEIKDGQLSSFLAENDKKRLRCVLCNGKTLENCIEEMNKEKSDPEPSSTISTFSNTDRPTTLNYPF